MKPKIFISYARVNKSSCKTIVKQIDDIYDVWYDKKLPGGQDWWNEIEKQLALCDIFIYLLSPDSVASEYCQKECNIAIEAEKYIIPVLIHAKTETPNELLKLQQVDLSEELEDINELFKALITAERTITKQNTRNIDIVASPKNSAEAIRAIIGEPFEWCEVPAGEFIYGDDENEYASPRQILNLPTFFMSKYPITYRQYQRFVNSEDGISDSRWRGRLTQAYDLPSEQMWKINDHPRENISWYEAIAFCRWLSHKLGTIIDLDKFDRWAVRLPTEFEWEKCARGSEGLSYPYGNKFDPLKCNTGTLLIGTTTPVTKYSNGLSYYGVYDLMGNVSEYCSTPYENPEIDINKQYLSSNTSRVIRGGDYSKLNHDQTHASYRWELGSFIKNYRTGFRIACSAVID